MNRNRKCRALLLSFTVILALASSASAEWKEKALQLPGRRRGQVGTRRRSSVRQAGQPVRCHVGRGGVYQLAPPAKPGGAWTESALYVFKGNTDGDGATPSGGLVIDGSGKLCGVTAYGGRGIACCWGYWWGVARCTIFSAIAKGRSVERDHPV
jgi:hypothetical protein